MRLNRVTFEFLYMHQQKIIVLKQLLERMEDKEKHLQDLLEDKEDAIERLKIEMISQVEEHEELSEDI